MVMALEFEVEGQMKKRRSKRTWTKQVEEYTKVGLMKEEVLCQWRWGGGIDQIAIWLK